MYILNDLKVAVWTGLEPATSCVTGRHSNQLNYQTISQYIPLYCTTIIRKEKSLFYLIWWREQDLNLRPLGYEPNELPDCSIPRYNLMLMVEDAGFEPATPCL